MKRMDVMKPKILFVLSRPNRLTVMTLILDNYIIHIEKYIRK